MLIGFTGIGTGLQGDVLAKVTFWLLADCPLANPETFAIPH